jgi:LysM repeat protein
MMGLRWWAKRRLRRRLITGTTLAITIVFSFALGFTAGESSIEITESAGLIDTATLETETASLPTSTATLSNEIPPPTNTPAPTKGSSPTPTPTAETTIHTVRAGDNLYRLSQRYNVPVELILASNNLANPSKISVGQGLVIPLNGVAAPSPTLMPSTTPIPPPTAEPMVEIAMAGSGADDSDMVTVLRPASLHDVPVETFIVMPEAVREHVRAIFAYGQELGRNAHAFSRVGDSTIQNPYFLARFDTGPYNLGNFAYLQDAVDYFAGSFGREGLAVRRGLHSWALNDPLWADPSVCLPNEGVVACELRVHNAAVIFFRIGSNDVGRPDLFEKNMRESIELVISMGVIPVIGTKADRFDGEDNPNNNILRSLAAEYQIPLWDYDVIAEIIPERGLGPDAVHMTSFSAHDWTSPEAFQRGHGVHNLTALMMLDALMQTLSLSLESSANAQP